MWISENKPSLLSEYVYDNQIVVIETPINSPATKIAKPDDSYNENLDSIKFAEETNQLLWWYRKLTVATEFKNVLFNRNYPNNIQTTTLSLTRPAALGAWSFVTSANNCFMYNFNSQNYSLFKLDSTLNKLVLFKDISTIGDLTTVNFETIWRVSD
jgi:hypothetical protein